MAVLYLYRTLLPSGTLMFLNTTDLDIGVASGLLTTDRLDGFALGFSFAAWPDQPGSVDTSSIVLLALSTARPLTNLAAITHNTQPSNLVTP